MSTGVETELFPVEGEMPAVRLPGNLVGREVPELHLGHNQIRAIATAMLPLLHVLHALRWHWKASLLAGPQSGSQNTPLAWLPGQPGQSALQEQGLFGLKAGTAVDHPEPTVQDNAHQHTADHSTRDSYAQGYGHLLFPWRMVRPGIALQIHFQALTY